MRLQNNLAGACLFVLRDCVVLQLQRSYVVANVFCVVVIVFLCSCQDIVSGCHDVLCGY